VVAAARKALDDTAGMRGQDPLTALNIKALREEIAHNCALGARVIDQAQRIIEDQNGVGAQCDLGSNLVEMNLHGFAVAGGQHDGGAGPALGADRPEHIGRLGALVVNGARPRALAGPAIGELVLLPDAHLVLKPHLC
jgi:hypothetical protein